VGIKAKSLEASDKKAKLANVCQAAQFPGSFEKLLKRERRGLTTPVIFAPLPSNSENTRFSSFVTLNC